jgi:multicomponent Na+:H+ antiporter subunit D
MGLFPRQVRSVILDTDWIYRKLLPAIISFVVLFVSAVWSEIVRGFNNTITAVQNTLANFYGPEGRVARVQPTGYMVLWLAILLGAALIVNLVGLP